MPKLLRQRPQLLFHVVMILFISLFPFAYAKAEGIRLFAWTAHEGKPAFVIAVRENETPKAASARYLEKLKASSELMRLFKDGVVPTMPGEHFEELSESRYDSQALLIANWAADYEVNAPRPANFAKLFSQARDASGSLIETHTFVLPMVADLGLTAVESADLRSKITRTFSLLTAMGGDDADPELYEDQNRHSRNVIPTRDRFEIQLIREYTKADSGFMLGICRGHQMTSVALGYSLIQDLPSEKASDVDHAVGFHGIDVLRTEHDFLRRSSRGRKHLEVNTYHHQAVVFKDGGPMVPAAVGPDGVIEALEFKNGRGITMQFHPELMTNSLGRNIMAEVIRTKNRTLKRQCTDLFRAAS